MDKLRSSDGSSRRRVRRRWLIAAAAALAGTVIVYFAIAPAQLSVARESLLVATAAQGDLIIEVRAPGVLAPRVALYATATSDGTVKRLLARPGAAVKSDTPLIELVNADVNGAYLRARMELNAATADAAAAQVTIDSQVVDQQARLAQINAEWESAKLQLDAELQLRQQGAVSQIQLRRSELTADQLATRVALERTRLAKVEAASRAQALAQQARLEVLRDEFARAQARFQELTVTAGIDGTVQEVSVQEGRRVAAGTALARVARLDSLQAELRVPETQVSEVREGQSARIDTRNGIIRGTVRRVHPTVKAGTVQVDVELGGAARAAVRADLSVDAVIEVAREHAVTYVTRPVGVQPFSTAAIFVLAADGASATRRPVRFGRGSAREIVVASGLGAGEQIVVSDSTAWRERGRISIQ